MKKLILVALTFSLFTLILSCGGGGTPKPPVVITPTEKTPVIDLQISPVGVIDYNGSFTATWNITNFGSGTFNGEAISASGSRTFSGVTENVVINMFAKNIQKTATKNMTVNIGEEKAPTITVTVTPSGIIPYHDTATISWTSTDATKVTIDSVEVALNGSQDFNNLIIGQNVVIEATNDTKTASETITIEVGDWTTSVYGMINHSYWRNTEAYFVVHDPVNGESTHSVPLTPEDIAQQWFYKDDGKYYVYNPGDSIALGSSQWVLDDEDPTILILGEGSIFKIEEITPDSFIYTQDRTWGNLPSTVWMVFKR